MEFERSLFQIYDRCLESIPVDERNAPVSTSSTCKFGESLVLGIAIFFLAMLITLHVVFSNVNPCFDAAILARAKCIDVHSCSRLSGAPFIVNIYIDRPFFEETDELGKNGFIQGPLLRTSRIALEMNDRWKPKTSPDYTYSPSAALAGMNQNWTRRNTHIQILDVPLNDSKCFGGDLVEPFLPLAGTDPVILNNFMRLFPGEGTLRTKGGDVYRWSEWDVKKRTWIEFGLFKAKILFASIVAFIFLSTIAALLLRVLLSSGVVFIFPLMFCLARCGSRLSHRVVYMSYPWIGGPLLMLHANRQSSIPFLIGHGFRAILYYVLYLAMQLLLGSLLYGQTFPSIRDSYLYVIVMLWEYFTLVYVRTTKSMVLFPRLSCCFILVYHFYIFSHPSGFHMLALLTLFCFAFWLMIRVVRCYELPAYRSGIIHEQSLRESFVSFPWARWILDLPPEFSLFMPVNMRRVQLYEAPVPAPPVAAAEPPRTYGTTGVTGATTAPQGQTIPRELSVNETTPLIE